MPLFHFSDDGAIALFEPRAVATPSPRRPGQEWLNGPMVWAIEDAHQAMYLFPRECPRILLWQTPTTTPEDRAAWWGQSTSRVIACVEWDWLERIRGGQLYRYELPSASFEELGDAGMWISRAPVAPLAVELIDDLMGALAACGVELRLMPRLTPLREVWSSSVHTSGVRLRNAKDWA